MEEEEGKERKAEERKKFLPPQAPRENDEVIRRENKTRLCFLIKNEEVKVSTSSVFKSSKLTKTSTVLSK